MPFESPDWPLGDLLSDIKAGKVQLPDFQRDWKWDDPRIASLLATITRGYPIGVLMTLETGGQGANFKPKPLSGAEATAQGAPDQLLLDGQQRMTSLFQTLMSGEAVDTTDARGKRIRRWYYIDIDKALADEGDREDAIVSVPEERKLLTDFGREVKADFSTVDLECAAGVFPLRIVFDDAKKIEWLLKYIGGDADRQLKFQRFQTEVLNNITSYLVPVIKLTKTTPKEAVCTVFEKVNTGGIPLNVFELLTATFAGDAAYREKHHDDFRLNDYWLELQQRFEPHKVLRDLQNTDFLQAVTLLTTYERRRSFLGPENEAPGVSCKRRDILRLTLDDFLRWAPKVADAFESVAAFLAQEHIFNARDVPYSSQLVPLAAIKVAAGSKAAMLGGAGKLRQWYWCGVLGELYGGTTETRFARDLEQVTGWLQGGSPPSTVVEAAFHEQRLLTLRTRNSAAYKGIYALLMREGGRDWMYDEPLGMAAFFNYKVDIHHIFPKAWCKANHIDDLRRESVVNKTALSRTTNIKIGGRSPAVYLRTIQDAASITPAQLDGILATHAIDPAALRAADFDAFFSARADALLGLVERAMGKPPVRTHEAAAEESDSADDFEPEAEEPEEDLIEQEAVA
jgi:hypothetical protein